ncbi:MAG: septum formation protein Maf [Clostridia bacterium]|nr:septum formation protein Maf [Clostridia bacterium]
MKIILASNSPRRRELLSEAGVEFTVIPSDFNEPENDGLSPEKYVEFLAYGKAKSVFEKCGGTVIGADTVVVLNGEILGKPKGVADAKLMLNKLSAKTHEVITGYAVISENSKVCSHEKTFVTFNALSPELIDGYVASGSPLDKAGAYGIQDGVPLVDKIIGDYDNVVGLPTSKILKILTELK